MPTTTAYEFGDVVLVPVPFSDLNLTKQRPAVVVSTASYSAEAVVISENEHLDLIIVMGITSQNNEITAVEIRDWKQAGLLHPSSIKPVIATLAQERVVRKLGKLTMADKNKVKLMLVKILNLSASSISPVPRS